MNPHQVTKDFEQAICDYTGAPYAVAVNSCTMALALAVAWHLKDIPTPLNLARPNRHLKFGRGQVEVIQPVISIPKRTYVSVAMAIVHAGGWPEFRDEDWNGTYQLKPLPIWDCARYFTSGMHKTRKAIYPKEKITFDMTGQMACVSFHASKTLGLEQGGAILHDDPEADAWFRRARFDGRTEGVAPKDDKFDMVGWHCYLNPSTAAQGILRLHSLPRHNAPLPNDEYPDLSLMEIFK